MPCYVALAANSPDAGIIMTIIWTLVTLGGFATITNDEDRNMPLFKLWIIIHLLDIMVMIWYFNNGSL